MSDFFSERILKTGKAELLASITTPTSVASGADIFTSSVTPTLDSGTFRYAIQFTGDLAGLVMQLQSSVTSFGGNILTNVGTLQADTPYVFDFPVNKHYSYNLKPKAATVVQFGQLFQGGTL